MMNKTIQFCAIAVFSLCLLNAFAAAPALDESVIAGALQTEDAFAAVVELAKPAVVVITNKQIAPQRRPQSQQMPPDLFRFFGIPSPFFDDEDEQQPWQQRPQRPRRVDFVAAQILRRGGVAGEVKMRVVYPHRPRPLQFRSQRILHTP